MLPKCPPESVPYCSRSSGLNVRIFVCMSPFGEMDAAGDRDCDGFTDGEEACGGGKKAGRRGGVGARGSVGPSNLSVGSG